MSLSSCSARTPVRSPGLKCTVACTRRVSLKKLPRSAHERPSSTSVVSSVLTSPPLLPGGVRPPRSVLLRGRLPSPRLRPRRRLRRTRKTSPRCVLFISQSRTELYITSTFTTGSSCTCLLRPQSIEATDEGWQGWSLSKYSFSSLTFYLFHVRSCRLLCFRHYHTPRKMYEPAMLSVLSTHLLSLHTKGERQARPASYDICPESYEIRSRSCSEIGKD